MAFCPLKGQTGVRKDGITLLSENGNAVGAITNRPQANAQACANPRFALHDLPQAIVLRDARQLFGRLIIAPTEAKRNIAMIR